jgi:hypothetical protein
MTIAQTPAKLSFEQGVQFAYLSGCKPLHPQHLRSYALKAADRDCFLSGYLKVLKAPATE